MQRRHKLRPPLAEERVEPRHLVDAADYQAVAAPPSPAAHLQARLSETWSAEQPLPGQWSARRTLAFLGVASAALWAVAAAGLTAILG